MRATTSEFNLTRCITLFAAGSMLCMLTGCGNKESETKSARTDWTPPSLTPTVTPDRPDLGPMPVAPPTVGLPATTIVISVNGSILNGEALRIGVARQLAPFKDKIPQERIGEYIAKARNRVVTEFVTRNLIMSELTNKNITITRDELQAGLSRALPPGMRPEEAAAKIGITPDQFMKNMEVRIKSHRLFEQALGIKLVPSAEEIAAEFDKQKDNLKLPERVHARHILISTHADPLDINSPLLEKDVIADKKKRLTELREELVTAPEKFTDYAKKHSNGRSATAGGDIGVFPRGKMDKVFEDAAFSQATNVIGEVIETKFGFHLIQVLHHHPEKQADFNLVRGQIGAKLAADLKKKHAPALQAYFAKLEANADVTYGPMIQRRPPTTVNAPVKLPLSPAPPKAKPRPTRPIAPAINPDDQ